MSSVHEPKSVCVTTQRHTGLKTVENFKAIKHSPDHVSIRNNWVTLSPTNWKAERNAVLNVFCISYTQCARFLHTDLLITRLQRVAAEQDHLHTTRRIFTKETCRRSDCVRDCAHFSILRHAHKHTNCHLQLDMCGTC